MTPLIVASEHAVPTSPEPPAAGRRGDRMALAALLFGTAALYLWRLGDSGWANAYYSAAAQAGSQSWKALFFGSTDASNWITVDKTPASIWPVALSVRAFGLNAWSVLVPQALAGVGSVALLYAAVRRWFGHGAGLLAGAVLAITPVVTLMFRFNNPDALLVLLLVAAAYAVVRALERAGTRWLVLAGALIGLAFLTKMLQALLVLPAFGAAYLLAAPVPLRRRLGQLVLGFGAMVGAGGWWVAIVELTPAAYRPYIGGSQHNSVLELALGYNGLGRLTGEEVGSVGGRAGWGVTGWTRLLGAEAGGQIGWLLPASVLLLAAGLVITARAPRTDRARAALVLWGGWLLVTAAVFSFMQGIFHAYYTVALAPAVGALAGIGATLLWRRRAHPAATAALAAVLAITALWSAVLLGRSPNWQPWLRPLILMVGLGAAAALVLAGRLPRRVAIAVAAVGLLGALAGPVAYAVETAATPHAGAIPSAGPAVPGVFGGPGRPAGAGAPGGQAGAPPGILPGVPSGIPPGSAGGATRLRPGSGSTQPSTGQPGTGQPDTAQPGTGQPGRGQPGGGLLNGSTPGANLVVLLARDADRYDWVAATVGANNAAGYQLASGEPVLAIGGFNGSDPSPTLAQFKQLVADGRIHFVLGGGLGMPGAGGGNTSQQIMQWVATSFPAATVDGVTVYDLTAGSQ